MGFREPRRIGSRRDVSRGGGGRELRRIGSRRDMSGGGGREPRRVIWVVRVLKVLEVRACV